MTTSRSFLSVATVVLLATLLGLIARDVVAQPRFVGVRPLGMGGALRASATGDAALTLNPSGMSLVRSYAVEGAYQHTSPGPEHVAHVSIVDSTSGFNMGGGLYYTYLSAEHPAAAPAMSLKESGHEGGFALSLPLGERVLLGGTVKYARLVADDAVTPSRKIQGFTFDAGLTIRPVSSVTIAAVGYNLRDLETARLPVAAGGGIAFSALGGLVVAVDGYVDFTTTDKTRGNLVSIVGGGEYVIGGSFAIRAGGGRDGATEHGYVTVGASVLAEIGAIDAGFRQDLSGNDKLTVLGIAGRLFVPSP